MKRIGEGISTSSDTSFHESIGSSNLKPPVSGSVRMNADPSGFGAGFLAEDLGRLPSVSRMGLDRRGLDG